MTLMIISHRTMPKFLFKKEVDLQNFMGRKAFFLAPYFYYLNNFSHVTISRSSTKNTRKNDFFNPFQTKIYHMLKQNQNWTSWVLLKETCKKCSSPLNKEN
jgi:hypothetical protein